MPDYFHSPFPFNAIVNRAERIPKLDLVDSIRAHLRSLILLRVGEFAYDEGLGCEIWDYDRQVFYRDRDPYYDSRKDRQGLLEKNARAKKFFTENLAEIVKSQELRLQVTNVAFRFDKVEGQTSVYQRKVVIEVHGKIKSTDVRLDPPFKMSILYAPFRVEVNSSSR